MMFATPEATASSTPYWMMGLSTTGSISLGCAFVAGRKRVPRPAAGNTALRIAVTGSTLLFLLLRPIAESHLDPLHAGIVDDHLGPPQLALTSADLFCFFGRELVLTAHSSPR